MSRTCGQVADMLRRVFLSDEDFTTFLGGKRVYGEEQLPGVEALDFITIGSADSAAFGRFGQPGEQVGLTIHLWSKITPAMTSRSPAKRRIYTMAAYIARAVNDKKLDIQGFGMVLTGRADLTAIIQDPAGPYIHGVMRFSGLVDYNKNAAIV